MQYTHVQLGPGVHFMQYTHVQLGPGVHFMQFTHVQLGPGGTFNTVQTCTARSRGYTSYSTHMYSCIRGVHFMQYTLQYTHVQLGPGGTLHTYSTMPLPMLRCTLFYSNKLSNTLQLVTSSQLVYHRWHTTNRTVNY